MAKKLYPEESVSDIAAAIREKNGSAERYNVAEMGEAVRAIPSGDTFWTQENRNNLATVLEKVPIVADSADEAASINTVRNSFISALRGGVTPAEPVLVSISVTPTSITVPSGTAASQVKNYLTSMTGYYETEGVAGQTTKDLTSQLSSVTVSGTMPTAGNTSTMTISYGGKSTTVSVTMKKADPTLTGLTATYTGGTVAAGTTLSQLTEVVKATYSDGTTSEALTKGTDYTLSGTLTAGQANTVTVTGAGTYAGFTTSFSVMVEAASSSVPIIYDTTMSRGGNTIQLYNLSGKPTSAQRGSTIAIELTPSLDWLAKKMPNEYILNATNKIDSTYTFATYSPISVNNNGAYTDKAGTNTNSVDITPTGDVTISSAPFIWIWGCGEFWTAPDGSVENENVYAPINQKGSTHLSSWSGSASNLMPIKSGRTYKFNMTLSSKKTRIVFFKWNGTNYISIGLWKSSDMTNGEVSVDCDNLDSTPSGLSLIGSTANAVAFAVNITGMPYNADVDNTLKKCYVTIVQR